MEKKNSWDYAHDEDGGGVGWKVNTSASESSHMWSSCAMGQLNWYTWMIDAEVHTGLNKRVLFKGCEY